MRTSHILAPAALGAVAVVASTILLILQIVLALPRSNGTSPTRVAAIISSFLESAVVILLSWLLFTSTKADASKKVNWLWFGSGIVLCVVAAALTITTLACLASIKDLGGATSGFLAGVSISLVGAFVAQLFFLVARFVSNRTQDESRPATPHMQEIGRRSPTNRVKTVPYSSTSPHEPSTRNVSMDSRSPPSSSDGFSAADTISSVASSLTNVVRPISSKTRLLSSSRSQHSQRSVHRPPSIDTLGCRERCNSAAQDSFDSWDTSGVDPQHRQTVLETSSPVVGSRLLETIPASPTTSRSPSPGTPLDLEPPNSRRRRSRSYSPAATRAGLQQPQRAFTQHVSASESHIHPLFRSDSPTPPPMASPGTVVMAAPQAGQVISDRQSVRSLNRIRSGSFHAVSPLTKSASFETFGSANTNCLSVASDGSKSDASGEGEGEMPERKITPPIPEYILNAGSRTSMHGYQMRKGSRDGPSGSVLNAAPKGTW